MLHLSGRLKYSDFQMKREKETEIELHCLLCEMRIIDLLDTAVCLCLCLSLSLVSLSPYI